MTARRAIDFVVGPSEAGGRLDRVIATRVPELSRARVQGLIEEGLVRLEGARASAARRVFAGQRIAIEIPPPAPARPQPESLPLTVLYEDSDILVVDKAPGMVVHPAPGHLAGTLVNALLGRYGPTFSIGGEQRPGIVHRLDRGTSGVLIVARNDAALAQLQRQFQRREVRKTYLAVVHGVPPAQGTLDTPYGRHPRDRKRFTSRVASAPRRALLHYRVQRQFATTALLEVQLATGRTHQIRVQLADAGFPLVGERVYGRRREPSCERPALHALRLECAHPRTRQPLSFEAALPDDLRALIARLEERVRR
ncbi:MAG: RluA family pseudouridine synthase [Deltaproteobacteria bacterium]|nr:RluA family pseudouridine synthase [Deltaproteobacteria bacterium]